MEKAPKNRTNSAQFFRNYEYTQGLGRVEEN